MQNSITQNTRNSPQVSLQSIGLTAEATAATAQQEHDLPIELRKVDANRLAKLELIETATKTLSFAKVIVFLNRSKSPTLTATLTVESTHRH